MAAPKGGIVMNVYLLRGRRRRPIASSDSRAKPRSSRTHRLVRATSCLHHRRAEAAAHPRIARLIFQRNAREFGAFASRRSDQRSVAASCKSICTS